ncbi:MAG: hypothetical protein ACK5PF_10865 [bacterium]
MENLYWGSLIGSLDACRTHWLRDRQRIAVGDADAPFRSVVVVLEPGARLVLRIRRGVAQAFG